MKKAALFAIIALLATGAAYAQDQDTKYTNESIARMSFVSGKTYVQRASDLGFEEGALNMPISEGDRIGTTDGRAEIHFGRGNYFRLDGETKIDVLNLPKKGDEQARIRVWSGSMYLVVGSLRKEKAIELHTADASFYVLDKGVYRVDVRENRDTEIMVYEGLIEAAGEEGSTLLKASQRLEVSEGRFLSKPSSFIAVAHDGFDKFNESRNQAARRTAAKSYLPEELGDFEAELEEHGEWVYLPPYGNVWVPGGVDDDWRPYHHGRWTWLPLTGWTWWPYEPWGWSTFHYGRWHWGVGFGWYWIPTSLWGPAWVNWWWDYNYFAWAPISYWGYPVVVIGGTFYGNYYGPYYPHGSSALTVIRRDSLKAPSVSANALRGDSLAGLDKMSLASRSLDIRPAGTKISVQPLEGNRVLLRRDDRTTNLERDRAIGRDAVRSPGASTEGATRVIRKQGEQSGGEAKAAGKSAASGASQTVKKDGQAAAASPARSSSSGASKEKSSSERNIRKKDGEPAPATGPAAGYSSSAQVSSQSSRGESPRTIHGYPSSPAISRAKVQGDGGAARSRSFSGPFSGGGSSGAQSRPSSVRSGSSSSGSSSRTGVSSSGSSRGSSSGSRGSSSSGSRGSSSSGSRSGSSGGSVRKK